MFFFYSWTIGNDDFFIPSKSFTIEWNGWRQPLETMVFRWFLSQATIGYNGFQWLSTIGPTMEWLGTIVEVYTEPSHMFILWAIHF